MCSGQVSVKKRSNSIDSLISWFSSIDPAFREDMELLDLVQKAMRIFSKIPNGKEIAICYQEDRELIGTELIFSNFKAGLFTVTVTGSKVEYYQIDRSVEKAVHTYRLKELLFVNFKKQLEYRLEYLAKKMSIFNIQNGLTAHSKMEGMSKNIRLMTQLRKDDGKLAANSEFSFQRREEFTAKYPYLDPSKDDHVIQLYRERRPEADQEPVPNFDNSALNGRVSIWSKHDLHKFYMKESKVNPDVTNYFGFGDKSKRKSLPKFEMKEKVNTSVDKQGSFHSTSSVPFFVKRFAKNREKQREQKASLDKSADL